MNPTRIGVMLTFQNSTHFRTPRDVALKEAGLLCGLVRPIPQFQHDARGCRPCDQVALRKGEDIPWSSAFRFWIVLP
jgi:hypothetical protein